MASKSRGGLSKKEFARATAAKAKPVVKKLSSPKSSGINRSGGVGSTPYGPVVKATMAGPTKPGSTVQPGYYNAATGGATPVKSSSSSSSKLSSKPKSSSSNRSLASKAIGLLTGAKTANAQESDSGIDYNTVGLKPNTIKQSGGIVSALGKITDPFGIKGKLRGAGFDIPNAPDLGISEKLGLSKKVPTYTANFADDQGRALTGSDQLEMYDYQRMQDEGEDPGDANIFMNNRKKAADGFQPQDLFRGSGEQRTQIAPKQQQNFEQDYQKTLENEMSPVNDYLNLANGPANAPLEDTPGRTVPKRFGSGAYGNGAGVGNPAGEDPYIDDLRKSLRGYGRQEDDVMRQFKNLIKALDPTYDEYEKEGKDALEKQLWNNNTSLASVMNANNTGDSEQRAQLMAGQQRDNQGQLSDLIRKLTLQKNEDIQGYKTKSVDAVNSIRDKKMSAQERIAQLIRQAQQESAPRASRQSAPYNPTVNIPESEVLKIQRALGVSRTQALKLAKEESGY